MFGDVTSPTWRNDNVIVLPKAAANYSLQSIGAIKDIVHEAVHAYTVDIIKRVDRGDPHTTQEKAVYDAITKWRENALSLVPKDKLVRVKDDPRYYEGIYYGLSNNEEFYAEFLAN
jgi:hypothetical protein